MTLCYILSSKYPIITINFNQKRIAIPAYFIKFLVATLIISFTVICYYKLGSYNKLEKYYTLKYYKKEFNNVLKNPNKIIAILEKQVANNPNDGKAMYLLGKVHLKMNNFKAANKILTKANMQKPDQIDIMQALLESTYRIDNKMNDDSSNLINKICSVDPNNAAALSILILDSYINKDYQTALIKAHKLQESLDPNGNDYENIRRMIVKINSKMMKKNNL